jgi:phage shock protein PspC (stress-responsive transcriptional regulator)
VDDDGDREEGRAKTNKTILSCLSSTDNCPECLCLHLFAGIRGIVAGIPRLYDIDLTIHFIYLVVFLNSNNQQAQQQLAMCHGMQGIVLGGTGAYGEKSATHMERLSL